MILNIPKFNFFDDDDDKENTKTRTPNTLHNDLYADISFDLDINQLVSKKPALMHTNNRRRKCKEYIAPNIQTLESIIGPAIKRLHDINTSVNETKDEEYFYKEDPDQYFIIESGEQLKNRDLNHIYSMISTVNNLKALASFDTQSFNLLYKTSFSKQIVDALNNYLVFDETIKYHFCHKLKDSALISNIILNCFNHIVKSKIFTDAYYKDDLEHFRIEDMSVITLQNISVTIGRTLASCYLNKYILYNTTSLDQELFTNDYSTPKNDKDYHPELKEKLLLIYDQIKNKTFNIMDLDKIIQPYVFDSAEERTMCYSLLQASFIENGFAGDPYSVENKQQFKLLFENLSKIYLQEGCNLIFLLQQANIINIVQDLQKTSVIEITDEIQSQALLSARFFKPYLSLINRNVLLNFKEQVYPKISLTISQQEIKHKYSSSIYNQPTKAFFDVIPEIDATQYKINVTQCNNIFKYIDDILHMPFDAENSLLLEFCHIVYNINFDNIFKNTDNLTLIKKIMSFALDFTCVSNKWLEFEVKRDSCATYLYNIIKTYKYNFIGLLNDVFIYKQFNYFYIPKYLSYTGRVISHPFFLQLQASKLVKSFVYFYATNPCFQQSNINDYNLFKDYLSSKINLTDMSIDFSTNHPITDYSWMELQQENFVLHNKYLASYFPKDFKINDYPINATFSEKVTWVSQKITKVKETFYVISLFEAKYSKNLSHVIYTKDATSSVAQHISLVMRNPRLAELSNLISKTPQDMYSHMTNIIISCIEEHYNNFLIPVFKALFHTKSPVTYFERKLAFQKGATTKKDLLQKELMSYLDLDDCTEKFAENIASNIKQLIEKQKDSYVITAITQISKIVLQPPFIVARHKGCKATLLTKTDDIFLVDQNLLEIYLKITKQLFTMYKFQFLSNVPLIQRDVMKTLVMPDGYNAGNKARLDSLTAYYKKCLCTAGYSKIPYKSIDQIAQLINLIYTLKAPYVFTAIKQFKKLCKKYIELKLKISDTQPVTIPMPHVTWSLHKYAQDPNKDYRPRIAINYAKAATMRFRFFSLLNTLNHEAMGISFASVFVHGIDAFIVYKLYEIIQDLNAYIKKNKLNLPKIFLNTNHDAFGINAPYSYFLKFLVAEAYNDSVRQDFLKHLLINIPEHQALLDLTPLKCTALDHFIKH